MTVDQHRDDSRTAADGHGRAAAEGDGRAAAADGRRAQTRARILEVALAEWRRLDDVAEQRGEWPNVRMKAIASEAGVALSTLYDHFAGQGVLAASVLRQVLHEDVFVWAEEEGGTGDPMARLGELVARLAQQLLAHRALTSTVIATASIHAIRQGSPSGQPDDPRTVLPLPAAIGGLVARGQQAGLLRTDVPAVEIGSSINNLLMLRVMTRPGSSAEDIAAHVMSLVVEGIRRR